MADKLRNLIREDFVKCNGMSGYGTQADAQADIIKDYVSALPGKDKIPAINSCEQIACAEAERLSAMIRKETPGWQYGQQFDTGILEGKDRIDIMI